MHELSITQNMLDIILKQIPDKCAKVTRINLKIGEFTYVDPECISFYFEQIAKNTPAEGAVIKTEKIPIQIKCENCGKENNFSKESLVFICPLCASKEVRLTSGRELFVESIEVE